MDWPDYWYDDATPWGQGYASTLPVDQADDVCERLRKVVEEVTGLAVEVPEPRRIGFL